LRKLRPTPGCDAKDDDENAVYLTERTKLD
jgi:hypothetical protein